MQYLAAIMDLSILNGLLYKKKEKKNNFVLILLDSTKKKVSIIPTIVQSFFLHADDILSKRTDQE